MVVLNSKQSSEIGSLPDHIIDNMRPNGRVRFSSVVHTAQTKIYISPRRSWTIIPDILTETK